jgi:hypothetical protein|tara:strand:- start:1749 stop:2054 length:306 start_codon:yes stop_codon:yes gene_type:complete
MAVVWRIAELERNTDNGVVTAHWSASDSETVEGVEHRGSRYGAMSFTPDTEAEDYIEYAELTEAVVVEWVKALLDVSAVDAWIAGQIEESKAPAVSTGVPW